MAYPTDLSALTNPTAGDDTSTVDHAAQHSTANDAIEALEAKVGVDSSAVTSSLDYKSTNAASVDPGHKHTPTTSLVITGTPDGSKFLRDDDTWAAPPTVVDADETTAGSVEEATTAETNAGTASGTVAKLFVTPAKLAASIFGLQLPTSDEKDALAGTGTPNTTNKYVTNDDVSDAAVTGKIVRATGTALPALSAINLTSITKLFDFEKAPTDVTGTTAVTIWSKSVGAGLLGTDNVIRVKILLDHFETDNTRTLTLILKYGSTSVATTTLVTGGATNGGASKGGGYIEAFIAADGGTSAQVGRIAAQIGSSNTTTATPSLDGESLTVFTQGGGTATEDSTGALTLSVTGQWSAGTNTLGVEDVVSELLIA